MLMNGLPVNRHWCVKQGKKRNKETMMSYFGFTNYDKFCDWWIHGRTGNNNNDWPMKWWQVHEDKYPWERYWHRADKRQRQREDRNLIDEYFKEMELEKAEAEEEYYLNQFLSMIESY